MPIIDPNKTGNREIDIFAPITEAESTISINDHEENNTPIQSTFGDFRNIWDDVSALWSTLPVSEIGTLISRENAVREYGVDVDFVDNELWKDRADPRLLYHPNGRYVNQIKEANNQQELDLIQENIYQNMEAKEKIGQYSFGYQMFLWSTSLLQDPLLLANPVKGVHSLNSFSKNFLIAGARSTGLILPWEAARIKLDPTSQLDELRYTLTGGMLFGGTIGSLIARYSKRLKHKEIDKMLDDSWDEINALIDMPRDKMYVLGSKQRTQNLNFENLNDSIDYNWQDDVLKTIDDSGGYKYVRNVFKYPMGLERSWLDESYDITTVLVKSDKISKSEGNEILDIVVSLSGDNSYLLTRTDDAVPPSVNTLYQKNHSGKIHTVKKAINDVFLEVNDINKGLTADGIPFVPGLKADDMDLNIQRSRFGEMFRGKNNKKNIVSYRNLQKLLYFERGYRSKNLDEFANRHQDLINTADRDKLEKIYNSVQKHAKVYGSVYDDFRGDLIRTGLLDDDYGRTLQRSINTLEKQVKFLDDRITKLRQNKSKSVGLPKVIQRLTKELEEAKILLKEEKLLKENYTPNITPKFQTDYVPIIYDSNMIRKNRNWVTNEIAKTYSGNRKEALKRAEETVAKMLKEGSGNFQNTSGTVKKGSSFLMERSLNLPIHVLKEIAITDPEIVFKTYYRRIAPRIELANKYGDISLKKEIGRVNEIYDAAILRAKNQKEIDRLELQRVNQVQNIEDMRDSLLGSLIHPDLGNKWNAKTARNLKNIAAINLGGFFGINSITDASNILAAQGFRPVYKQMDQLLNQTKEARELIAKNKQLLKQWGIISEYSMSTVGARLIEDDGVFPMGGKISQMLDSGANEIHKYSGLAPLTTGLKIFTGLMSQQTFISRMQKIAKGMNVTYVGPNKRPVYKVPSHLLKEYDILSMYGFSKADILDIGLQRPGSGVVYKELKGDGKGFYDINTDGWRGKRGQELADKFGTAVWSETNTLVMTPQMAQIPGWMKGVWRGVPHTKSGLKKRLELEKKGDAVTKNLQEAYKTKNPELIEKAQKEFFDSKAEISNAARTYAPLLSMMFQFYNFGVGASQKILGAYYQGRHTSRLLGGTAAITLAWMSQSIKNPYLTELPMEEQLLKSMEYTGVVSWAFNANDWLETLTPFLPASINHNNPISIRGAMGLDPEFDTNPVEGVFRLGGTPMHLPISAFDLLFNEDNTTKDRIRLIKSNLPFMNLPYTKPVLNKADDFIQENVLIGD